MEELKQAKKKTKMKHFDKRQSLSSNWLNIKGIT
jgi:hypothetical protein